ncbi:MAG: TRAP transporter substrate-binding protein DctP [Gammaproteobacteria bacterium]|nr:TRAP transporter substrate-binding protein DctP [Gammaproteobacteria bacterium]MCF6364132.1 TRAP transporter substrate-binding protein DctP [Gammaproteobacteria bacterium]
MKTPFRPGLLSILILALLLALPLSTAATTLKIATAIPDGTNWMKQLRQGAADIKKRTDGRVKIRFYPGGVMGNDNSVLRKIKVGQLHGAALTGGSLSKIYPSSQIYSLPFTFRDYAEVDYVRGKMDASIVQGLYDKGYVSFGISEGGFAYLLSRAPVTATSDLAARKIWIPEGDRINQESFAQFGISTIQLAMIDVLTALQTGLIDTVSTTPVGAIALQWHTRVKYLTDTPLLYVTGTIVVKRRAFEKLQAADQAIVREVMGDVFQRLNRINREDNRKAYEALKQQGIEFVRPTPKEIAEWRGGSQRAVAKLVKDGYLHQSIIDTFHHHLADYRASHPKTNVVDAR